MTSSVSDLLSDAARVITADRDRGSAPALRVRFDLDDAHGRVTGATLRATAFGVCEAYINGSRVSPDVLTPGWSSYEWRLRVAEWEVGELLAGTNTLGILVGNGWHSGYLGFAGSRSVYGPDRGAIADLSIRFEDGHMQTVATDASWSSGPSPILADDLYNGETIDARVIDPTWAMNSGSETGWSGVRELDFDHARLTPYVGPPVRRQEEIAPVRAWTSPAGRTLVDFGQNAVGWLRLDARGPRGQQITVRHAEVLENGELGVRPLRRAEATDRFVLSGGADEFEPTFTFHGFRYAEIEGWPGTLDELTSAVRLVVIGSELERIGTFACSDPLLNQLHANVVWGMRGNFVDVPTDCPQRDERLGWTGDLAAFVSTATFLYDVDDFLRDWLLDLAAEQASAGGAIPIVVPDNIKYDPRDPVQSALAAGATVIALWNDAVCWVPWALWEAYGDREVLEQQYGSITSYARRLDEVLGQGGVFDSGFQLGDWLDPTAPPEMPHMGKSDAFVVATACVYRSTVIAADTAALLGHPDDAEEFGGLANRIRDSFQREFVDGGRIKSDASAVYALAITFGLLTAEQEIVAGNRLAQLAEEADYTITTGFAGTPFILGALSKSGHLDTAYRMLLERECPSWLYPVTMGATTVWERWDSMLPDGSINPGEMTSFNHYAFGAVADWMHSTIAGIAPLEPGYRSVLIAPNPGGDLSWVECALKTPQGQLSVQWQRDGEALRLEVEVPESVTAVVRLPGEGDVSIAAGRHRFDALMH